MYIQTLNTWTICILLPVVIPKFSLGLGNNEHLRNAVHTKTMYDAVAEKCPNIEKSALKKNDLLSKSCLNWSEINITSSFTEKTKVNVECIVFYEALVSFCTEMGDKLLKVDGIIPPTLENFNYTLETVCNNKFNVYPEYKTEHNISSLIQSKDDCLLLCTGFTPSRVSDICKFAYYFGTFNVSKFNHNLEILHEDHHKLLDKTSGENNPPVSDPFINNTKQLNGPKGLLQSDQIDTAVKAAGQPLKPQETEPIQKPYPVPPHDDNVHVEPEIKPAKEQITNIIIPIQSPEEKGLQSSVSNLLPNKKDTVAANVDNEAVPNEQVKENADLQQSKPETVPEKGKMPETNEKSPQDANENQDYAFDDNSPTAKGDRLDQAIFGHDQSDAEQEDGNVKKMPVMPDEQNDLKTPIKKVKPSTVEDEAVSNFNAPEDDMDGDSYFFSYFTVIMCLFIVGYVGYHNRQKILALILEGKKGRKAGRGRRPNSANYHKLDTNLEEAISSSCTKNTSNVIY